MKKDQLIFLFCGVAFGFLLGFGVFSAIRDEPDAHDHASHEAQSVPAQPAGPAQMGGSPPAAGGGAPMMAEIGRLRQVLEADPENLEANIRLANLYHDAAMFAQAIPHYEAAVKQRPDDPDLITDLGVCLQGSGNPERAIELFDQAHELAPQHWKSLFNKVVVAGMGLKDFETANAALVELEALRPNDPNVASLRHGLEQTMAAEAAGAPPS